MTRVGVRNRPQQGRSIAYGQLKDAIQYLEFMPGSMLIEGELIERMGIGRTPIREALIRLSEEYLVNVFPQSGTYVSNISFELAREVAYMRHLLDKDVCMKLCRDKAKMGEIVDEQVYFMRSAMKKNDVVDYIKQDNRFHGIMFKYSGHGMIWNIISNSRAHYNRVLMLDLARPGKLAGSLAEHLEMVKAIETGDELGLELILDNHHDHNMDKAFEAEIRSLYPQYFKEA